MPIMAATAFFPVPRFSSATKPLVVKPMPMQVKPGLKTKPRKVKDEATLSPPFCVLLSTIATVFLPQWTLIDWKTRHPDMLIYRQNFSIRSYETGADRTASIVTLMSHLQETAINHMLSLGLMAEGYGSTAEMSSRNLIWVITKMQVHVERYPLWGDIVEADTWYSPLGKNGVRRNWHLRDGRTGETVMRASSVWIMMNKLTRRLSRLPAEVRAELDPTFLENTSIVDKDDRRLVEIDNDTADYVRRGLTPHWNDLDANQHVNNVKYIGWILESVPMSILETHELASMTLEYRKECGRKSVLESLTSLPGDSSKEGSQDAAVECHHLLRLEDGADVMRGRTEWRPKHGCLHTDFAPIQIGRVL